MSDRKRIVFAGTPEFAASALEALLEEGHTIVAVYTQPDRPAGRGQRMMASAVKQVAVKHEIPVEQPLNFKSEDSLQRLRNYQPDIMIVAAYGIILPQAVLDIPVKGCLNIHASLLPRWRGAAPIQRAIEAGDTMTGITIMQMDAGLDTGAMLLKVETPITATDTAASLHDRLADLGGKAICEALRSLDALYPVSQDDSLATYARKLQKLDGEIDWSQPASVIGRMIRAFTPWPAAFSRWQETNVKILAGRVVAEDHGQLPGIILSRDADGISVACDEGALLITHLQWPGAKAMSAQAFFNGHPDRLTPGTSFSFRSES